MYLLDYDLAIDRMRERANKGAEAQRLAIAIAAVRDRSPVRRRLALALAGLSRISAAGVRRLDSCLADDLGRQLAGNR